MQAFTKWVPSPGAMGRQTVESAVNVSLRRMDTDRLDLLQFHWWEYSDPRYLDALKHLAALRDEGRIRHVALTNFDTARLERILGEGIAVVSNQVQYSLVDMRPDLKMAPICSQHDVQLLTYGTLCGGLLTDRFLDRLEPGRAELNTASLQKYKRMIDAWGGWDLFQRLLRTLREIADKHNVSIANVAVRAILDKPSVGGVIVGARLGIAEHIADNERVFALRLDDDDTDRIAAIQRDSRDLLHLIGDCGDEYRR
jgi:aryl-alcohol dehydrogenase-like predicted oxidoreductase